MKTVFWNGEERRLRAVWRLLIQFILFFALLVLVVMLEGVLEDLFGRLPRHPWFGHGDSIFLPFEMLLVTVLSMWLAVVIIAIIFGALHYDTDAGMISLFALIAAGLLYAAAFLFTGQLALPIGFHVAGNFFQGSVFGFPVSGIKMGTSFIALQETGPDLWTGGTFGPETGLLGIGAHLAAILAVLLWARSRRGGFDLREKMLTPSLLASERSLPCNGKS